MNAEWSQEFHSLTAALFTESSLSKDRFDYTRRELRKELVRLINEVKNMPATDGVAMHSTPSPTNTL